MLGSIGAFIELGGIVFAWWIFWSYLTKAFVGHHNNSPAAAGLAAVLHS